MTTNKWGEEVVCIWLGMAMSRAWWRRSLEGWSEDIFVLGFGIGLDEGEEEEVGTSLRWELTDFHVLFY